MTKKFKTRIAWCKPECSEKYCCSNCTHYGGGIEFIPFRIHLKCHARKGTYDHITLPGNGIPIIDGVEEKECQYWEAWKEV
jgi:hypothetical protein